MSTRVRAEKMKLVEGRTMRYCPGPLCNGTYLPIESFGARRPRPTKGEASESAKYQSYCKACVAERERVARSKRSTGAIA